MEAHASNEVDEDAAHDVKDGRHARVEHEAVVDEDLLLPGHRVAVLLRLLGGGLAERPERALRVGVWPGGERGLHGGDSPGPGEAHAKEERERGEQVGEEHARGRDDEEDQRAEKGGQPKVFQHGLDEDEEEGDPGGGPAPEDDFAIVGVEMVEEWRQLPGAVFAGW